MPMNTTLETRPGPPGTSPRAMRPGAGHDLLDDLAGGHVPGQPGLAGGAERAVHAAAGLRGHAHRGAVAVAHQHRLDRRAVEQAPQGLASGAVVGRLLADRGEQLRGEDAGQLLALGGRDVGPLGRVVGEVAEVVLGDLRGAEALVAELGQRLLALGRGEVGQVARRLGAARGGEGQLAGRGGFGAMVTSTAGVSGASETASISNHSVTSFPRRE